MDVLFSRLERRLDNVVYKLGLAPTRAMARQLVSHGHILLNGKKLSIPSAEVKIGDKITIRKGSLDKTMFSDLKEKMANNISVDWLSFDLKKKEGKVIGNPILGDQEIFDFKSIMEFYGR